MASDRRLDDPGLDTASAPPRGSCTMARDQIWVRAYCSFVRAGGGSQTAIVCADQCLAAYDERFPILKGPM